MIQELQEFERYLAHLGAGLGHADRLAGLRGYCTGLMAPLARKRVVLIDTAGLRETADPVEKIGIERTWAAIGKADLVLLLLDSREGVTEHDRAILAKLPEKLPVLRVFNKIDLTGQVSGLVTEDEIHVSAKGGQGLAELRRKLLQCAGWQGSDDAVFIARERHLDAIRRASGHLQTADAAYRQIEILAEELRLAQNALNEITGEFTPDDLLGVIFSRFCIGK